MRILLVEDDAQVRTFLEGSLMSEHFSVDATGDGEKGSYLARTNQYDLIVLDNILPSKSGAMICRELRGLGSTTPILMLTVQGDVSRKVELFNLGADDYMTKPFILDEFMARVRALLRRPKPTLDEVVIVADLRLNSQTYQVYRGSKTVYLTRKEFELLEYMMRNKNKVLSRGMIMEHVWDIHADPFSNTIETHILNVRKKIEMKGKKKLIHTFPGRGYMVGER